VSRMQHLLEQLLSLYRTTPEKFAENCHELDLYQIVQDQIAHMYSSFEKKNQKLELEGNNVIIEGDQFALETLISNLLSNANKYTPEGGSVRVRVDENSSAAVLSVEDSGPGIPAEDRERIFDRFYRADFSEDRNRIPGCGLGLTIVAHIAELHHARVVVEESGMGSGSAFRVYFEKKSRHET
jgi:two-component system sensor histidine kinase QseC